MREKRERGKEKRKKFHQVKIGCFLFNSKKRTTVLPNKKRTKKKTKIKSKKKKLKPNQKKKIKK